MFGIILHSGSVVACGTFGQYLVGQILFNKRSVWFPAKHSAKEFDLDFYGLFEVKVWFKVNAHP
jgi:hypothetical protein